MAVVLRRLANGATYVGTVDSIRKPKIVDPTLRSKIRFDGECDICKEQIDHLHATLVQSTETHRHIINKLKSIEHLDNGELIKHYQRIPIEARWKGWVCSTCLTSLPVRPYWSENMETGEERDGFRKGKGFNTKITQSRHLSRS